MTHLAEIMGHDSLTVLVDPVADPYELRACYVGGSIWVSQCLFDMLQDEDTKEEALSILARIKIHEVDDDT